MPCLLSPEGLKINKVIRCSVGGQSFRDATFRDLGSVWGISDSPKAVLGMVLLQNRHRCSPAQIVCFSSPSFHAPVSGQQHGRPPQKRTTWRSHEDEQILLVPVLEIHGLRLGTLCHLPSFISPKSQLLGASFVGLPRFGFFTHLR